MFDVGFLELLICGIIALLVLGPERLPGAARTAGRWIGRGRRLVSQYTTELDRQLKADELREKLRQEGDVGLEDVKKNVDDAMKEARKYERMIVSGDKTLKPRPGYENQEQESPEKSAAREEATVQKSTPQTGINPETEPPIEQQPKTSSGVASETTTASDSSKDHPS